MALGQKKHLMYLYRVNKKHQIAFEMT